MLARCDLLRLLRQRGGQKDAWVSGGHIGEDKQCDTLLSSDQRWTNILDHANTYDLAIYYGATECWWTVNELDKVDGHTSDGCCGMLANRRLHAPRMRGKQPDCDC